MTIRYYVPDLSDAAPGAMWTLSAEESNHAVRVMRIEAGQMVELFDGKCNVAAASVSSPNRRGTMVRIEQRKRLCNMPAVSVEVDVAFPKPERCKEMIARLTELGVRCVTPIVCHRTQRPPSDSLLEKLRRGVIEACKQSGRNELMTIGSVVPFRERLKQIRVAGSNNTSFSGLIAHPGIVGSSQDQEPKQATGGLNNADAVKINDGHAVRVLVGPEGGFDDQEVVAAIGDGYRPVNLGTRIYRIETAAVVLASLVIHQSGMVPGIREDDGATSVRTSPDGENR